MPCSDSAVWAATPRSLAKLTVELRVGITRVSGVVQLALEPGALSKQRRWRLASLNVRVERGANQTLELRGSRESGLTTAINGKTRPTRTPQDPSTPHPAFGQPLLQFRVATWPVAAINGRNPLLQMLPTEVVAWLALLLPRGEAGPLDATALKLAKTIATLDSGGGPRMLGRWRFSSMSRTIAPCGGLGCDVFVRFAARPDPPHPKLGPTRVLQVVGKIAVRSGLGMIHTAELRFSGALWLSGTARPVSGRLVLSSRLAP